MKRFLFSFEVIMNMLSECYRMGSSEETGGIVIGPTEHNRIITDSIPSSSYAERQPSTYYQTEKDVDILNKQLRKYQKNAFDFKGYYHRHPPGFNQLSQGDVKTCLSILTDPNYKINGELLMIIVTEDPENTKGLPIFAYLTILKSKYEVAIEQVAIEVVQQDIINKVGTYIWGKEEQT